MRRKRELQNVVASAALLGALIPMMAAVASATPPATVPARSEVAPGPARSASAPAPSVAPNDARAGGFAPDPPPTRTRHQWIVELSYHEGVTTFLGSRRVELSQAISTVRNVGRFALELYVGPELLDRVRFDFPLLGADDYAGQRPPWEAPPSFERHLKTATAVMIPENERATRLTLVDRATGRTMILPYPLGVPAAGRGDAGASSPADHPPLRAFPIPWSGDIARDAGRGDARRDRPSPGPLAPKDRDGGPS